MSTFRVAGKLDDTLYEVVVTGDASSPVVGSRRVAALVEQYTGRTVLATPTGPAYKVDPKDRASVLALLHAHTEVRRVGSEAPKLVEPPTVGAVR